MNPSIDWKYFWDQLGTIIIITAVIIVFIVLWLIWRRVHDKKAVMDARVVKVRELTDAYPTMYVSRNSILAWGIRKIDVTFATYDPSGSPGEVVLRTPIRKAEKLVEGMKGRLCYRGTTFLSFFPDPDRSF